jgi:hypothetical protein
MSEDICERPQITRLSLGRARGMGYQLNDSTGRHVVFDEDEAVEAAKQILVDYWRRDAERASEE